MSRVHIPPAPQGEYIMTFQQMPNGGLQQVMVPVSAVDQQALLQQVTQQQAQQHLQQAIQRTVAHRRTRSPQYAEQSDDSEALHHSITGARLKAGLWSSADCCERCWMIFGGLVLLFFCYVAAWDECTHLYRQRAMHEAVAALQEEPCVRQGLAELQPGKLIHLTNCSVEGRVHFTSNYPDLEELELFEDNLPSNITGAWFDVQVFYNHRRRGGGWAPVTYVSNVQAKNIVAPNIYIGDHSASSALTNLIPGGPVPVKTAANYAYGDTGWFGSSPGHLSSKNMKPIDGVVGGLEAPDVNVFFLVGDAQVVSVLAGADSTGQLVPWNASSSFSGLGGAQVNRMEKGAVTAEEMLGKTEAIYSAARLSWRLESAGWIWLGTWLLLYAKHVCTCCRGRQLYERYGQLWNSPECWRWGFSLVWSLLWSLVPTAGVMLLSWLGYRFPLVFVIVGAVCIPCLVCLACGLMTSLWNFMTHESDSESEEDPEKGVAGQMVQIASTLLLSALLTTLATSAYIYWVYMPSHHWGNKH